MRVTETSDHRIETGAGALFARDWRPAGDGLGPALILLHDSLGSVALWRDFPERLAKATGRRVIAYDRLGFGLSDPPPRSHPHAAPPLPADFVEEEARTSLPVLLDHFRLDRFAPIGHSVGGGMAIAAAALHPERCERLVTIAAQVRIDERTRAGIRAAKAGFAEPGQIERLARHHGDKARWVLDAWTETWLDPGFAGWSLESLLPKVTCPVLAVHGDRDEYALPNHASRIADGVAGDGTTLILTACGHVPHRERPENLTGAVAAFITS